MQMWWPVRRRSVWRSPNSILKCKTVAVCTGGGGLLAGIALGLQDKAPQAKVVGVQAAGAASYPASLRAGHPVAVEHMATLADGIAVAKPGQIDFDIIAAAGIDFLTVDDEQIARAVLMCLERSKQLVEPGGAAAAAAVLSHPELFEPPVVVTLSGGNVDPLAAAADRAAGPCGSR